jgi:starvation-inducible DNA-binding protein
MSNATLQTGETDSTRGPSTPEDAPSSTVHETESGVRTLMRDSATSIPLPDRVELVALLNQLLADIIDLRLQIKQAHWNVRGIHFQALHELFDEVAAHLPDYTDEIAERAGTLGGAAIGSVSEVAKTTRLDAMPNAFLGGRDALGAVKSRLAFVANAARRGIDSAADFGDEITADVLTEVTRGLDQQLWFVESHLDR